MSTTEDILERLVAFPTVSRDPNDGLIRYAAQTLEAAGFRTRIFEGPAKGKADLLASIGPENEGGLILSGHSDVVPVDGQDWASDAFRLTERGGRLHARGAVDMKGFLAAGMAAGQRAAGRALQRPLHLAFSYDEEVGCLGVRVMLAALAKEGFKAAGCIVGEPTELGVVIGHKGKVAGCIRCRGEAAHSSNPGLGCNAINLAGGMIRETELLQEWLCAHGARDAAYAVPYSTVHVGTIQGGSALNIVPEHCEVGFEIRFLPGDEPEALVARLREAGGRLAAAAGAGGRHAEVGVTVETAYPGMATDPQAAIVSLVRGARDGAAAGKVAFGTEGGLFDESLGLGVVVCGPGSIDRAHKPDEFITRAELAACDAFLDRVIGSLG